MGYAIVAFLAAFTLVVTSLLLLFYRQALGERLSRVLHPRGGSGILQRLTPGHRSEAGSAATFIRRAPALEQKEPGLARRLALAGYRRDYYAKLYFASRFAVPLLLVIIAAATGVYRTNPFLVFGAALGLGYLLPDYWLDYRIRCRAEAIERGLPDLLDLMVVCLEAGLSIDQSAIRSGEEMRFSHPAIADELSLVMLEVRAGQPRMEAWKRLAERTDLDAVRMFVTILVQADQFGTGISRTLRVHSDTMRTRRKQKVEEAANKTSVKLIFPLALFIFPTFFIVILGPAVILIVDNFVGLYK